MTRALLRVARRARHCAPSRLLTADFNYALPPERIAQEAAEPRDASKLLVRASSSSHHDLTFRELPSLLRGTGAHLVLNESAVFAARLLARPDGADAPAEVLFLAPEPPSLDATAALAAPADGQLWRAMVRLPLERAGLRLTANNNTTLRVERLLGRWAEPGEGDGVEAAVRVSVADGGGGVALRELLSKTGDVPLPPYIRRAARPDDAARYQAVFANADGALGSVAAPTASLHFTDAVLDGLAAAEIRTSRVALHVGAGTFKPVTAARAADHTMHAERFAVAADELEDLAASAAARRPIVPVGTTSARVLESLYWLGARELRGDGSGVDGEAGLRVEQWTGHGVSGEALPPLTEAFAALAAAARARGDGVVRAVTELSIAPGYELRAVDALVTNFHAPDSTLMWLVATAAGGADNIHAVYEHALSRQYRFLSYGDACLLVNHDAAARAGSAAAALAGRLHQNAVDITAAASPAVAAAAAAAPVRMRTGERRKVLLHSCCAPCSGAMVEAMVDEGHDVTIFFYNPNIHPKKEYEMRKEENKRFASELGIPFLDVDGDVDEWYRRAKGMEFCPERGARCSMCFDMRLERTALHASEHGFDSFTTTNATSRWKDEAQVNASGFKAAAKYDGVEYWASDWQTAEMTARKYRINAERAFYKQEYCGCSYSLRDSNHWRSQQGMPPVQVGGDTTYSDPEADEQEESVEVVKAFFEDAQGFEEEIRRTYAGRRKGKPGGASSENW